MKLQNAELAKQLDSALDRYERLPAWMKDRVEKDSNQQADVHASLSGQEKQERIIEPR